MGLKVLKSQPASQRITAVGRHGSSLWVGLGDGVILSRDAATGNLEGFISGRSDVLVPSVIYSTVSGALVGYRNGSIRLFPILPNHSHQVATETLQANVTPIEILKGFDDGTVQSILCARNIVYYVKKHTLYMLDLATRVSVPLADPFATAVSRVTSILLVSSTANEQNPDALWVFSTSTSASQSALAAAVSSAAAQNHLTVIPINPKTGVADASQAKKEVIRTAITLSASAHDDELASSETAPTSASTTSMSAISSKTNREAKSNPNFGLANSAIIYSTQLSGVTAPHVLAVTASGQLHVWRVSDRKLVGWGVGVPGIHATQGICVSQAAYLQPSLVATTGTSFGVIALFSSDGGVEAVGISQTELTSATGSQTPRHRPGTNSTGSASFSSSFKFTHLPTTALFPGSIAVAAVAAPSNGASSTTVASWQIWVATALSSESTHLLEITPHPQGPLTSPPAETDGNRCRLHTLGSLRVEPSMHLIEEVMNRAGLGTGASIRNALEALSALRSRLSAVEAERNELKLAVEQDKAKLARVEAEVFELTTSLAGMDKKFEAKLAEDKRAAYEQGQEDANAQIEVALEKLKNEREELTSASEELTTQVSQLTESLQQKTNEVTLLQSTINEQANTITTLTSEISGLKSEVERLQNEIQVNQHPTVDSEEVNRLRTEIQTHKDEVQTYRTEAERLQNALSERTSEVQGLQSHLDMKASEVTDLQNRLNLKTSEVSDLQNRLDSKTAEASDLQGRLDMKTSEVTGLQILLDAKASEISSLQNEAITAKDQVQSLEVQLVDYKADLVKAQETIASLTSKSEPQPGATTDSESKLREEIAALKEALAALEKEAADQKQLATEYNEARQAEKARADKLELEKTRTEMNNMFANLKVQTLEQHKTELESEIASLKDAVDAVRQEGEDRVYQELREHHRHWENKLEESISALEAMTRSYFELREEYDRVTKEYERLQSLRAASKESSSKATEAPVEGRSAEQPSSEPALELVDGLEDITHQYHVLRSTYDNEHRKLIKLEDEVKQLRSEVNTQLAARSSLEEKLEAVSSEKAQMNLNLNALMGDLATAEKTLQQKVAEFGELQVQLAKGIELVEIKAKAIEQERDEALEALEQAREHEASLTETLNKQEATAQDALKSLHQAVAEIRQNATAWKLEKEVSHWLPATDININSQIETLAILAQPNPRILDGTLSSSGDEVKDRVDPETVQSRVTNAIAKAAQSVEQAAEQHKKLTEIAATRASAKKDRLQSLMEQINAIGGEGFVLQVKKSSEPSEAPQGTLITTGLLSRSLTDIVTIHNTKKSVLEVVHDAAKQVVQKGGEGQIKVIETDALFIPTLDDLNLELAKLAKEGDLLEVIQQELSRLQNFELIARDAVQALYLLIRRFENMTDLVAVKKTSAFRALPSPLLSPPLSTIMTTAFPSPTAAGSPLPPVDEQDTTTPGDAMSQTNQSQPEASEDNEFDRPEEVEASIRAANQELEAE